MSYDKANKKHIVAVNAAIRNGRGEYLILQRSAEEKAYPNAWVFPGGKAEGLQTIDESLTYEVAEETGLTLKRGKILIADSVFTRPDDQTVHVLVFLCDAEPDEVVLEDGSFIAYAWVKPEELDKYDHVGLDTEIARAEELIAEFSQDQLDKLKIFSE